MIVATERIASQISAPAILQNFVDARFGRQIVHAQTDDALRARNQRLRIHALGFAQPFHVGLITLVQPFRQVLRVFAEVGVGNAHLLKAELAPPALDVGGERGQI